MFIKLYGLASQKTLIFIIMKPSALTLDVVCVKAYLMHTCFRYVGHFTIPRRQAVDRACKFYETWNLDMKRYARYLSNMIFMPFPFFI